MNGDTEHARLAVGDSVVISKKHKADKWEERGGWRYWKADFFSGARSRWPVLTDGRSPRWGGSRRSACGELTVKEEVLFCFTKRSFVHCTNCRNPDDEIFRIGRIRNS